MRPAVLLFVLGAFSACTSTGLRHPYRNLQNGCPACVPKSFDAWTVLFTQPNGTAWCGGTLIAPDWVLTAAHCVCHGGSYIGPNGKVTQAELLDAQGIFESYNVDAAYPYPQYQKGNCGYQYDVALVHLSTGVSGTSNLPQLFIETIAVGSSVTLLGRAGIRSSRKRRC